MGVLHAAVATPPSGRDKSGPYPRGHRFARLSAAIRHQYPIEGRRATIKAHPTTPHPSRPYDRGISLGRTESPE
ncbi:MAG TPA: hypothetical protein VKP04_05560, partial [Ktedonobacteraceae bacterium]|nr:hypothetical protein [Ktedonobacteraceae bacterium]